MSEYLQFDNFACDAHEIRAEVIAGPFGSHTGPDGALYTGISLHPVKHWTEKLSAKLGKLIKPGLSCFRMNLDGELPHSWVHSDGICAERATVLYLNTPEQCTGGTAFWKHRKLGIDRLPSKEELGKDWESFYKQMDKDWKVLDLWEQIDFVPMRWNRLITYSTALFHSRFPFSGFGKGPSDGRLIWICFYDLGEPI
jgi:hypothetical protein